MINRLSRKQRLRYRSILYNKYSYRKRRLKYATFNVDSLLEYTIYFPRKISLSSEYRDLVILCVERMHYLIKEGFNKIRLNFSKTREIYADGMILIYAEICNILNIEKNIKFLFSKIRQGKILQILKQIGILKICNHSCSITPTRSDVVHWRVCAGVEVIGENFDNIVNPEKELKSLPPEIDLYGGCIEATKNAKRHAYIMPRELSKVANSITSWWIFSQIRNNKLTIVVCDLGITIPKTLPKQRLSLYQYIQSTLSSSKESNLIWGAIEKPLSRSLEDFRGNGLPKIAEIATKTAKARLTIHSGRGCVFINKKEKKIFDYKKPIPGTIISWTLPLGNNHD